MARQPARLTDRTIAARYEARARIVKALAHPTRLFLVDQLAQAERCVCDLTELVGADTSTVSKHLSILRAAGLVRDEKRGNMVFYRLSMPCVLDFLGCAETVQRQTAAEHARLLTPV